MSCPASQDSLPAGALLHHPRGRLVQVVAVLLRNGGARERHPLPREADHEERGKIADLLVLTQDPRVNVRAFRSLTHVMRGGRLHRLQDLSQR